MNGRHDRRFCARVEPAAGLGAKLRELRDRRGYSQQQLADGLGWKREQISDYERGIHRPEGERVGELDRALGAGGELLRLYVTQETIRLVELLEAFR